MQKIIISAAIAAAITTVAQRPAIAGNDDILVGNRTSKTEISGHTGTERYLGWKPRENRWFYAAGWGEKKDRPCAMTLYGMGFDDDELVFASHRFNSIFQPIEGPHRKLRDCTPNIPSIRIVGGALASKKVARVVGAVAVCTSRKKNSSDERLKGIKLWFRQLDLGKGTISSEEAVEHDYRTNCKTWHPKVSCPRGQGAIGFRVMSTDEGIRGLGLVCAPFAKGMTRPE